MTSDATWKNIFSDEKNLIWMIRMVIFTAGMIYKRNLGIYSLDKKWVMAL